MRRNAKCVYGVKNHYCGLKAVRSVLQKPYCKTHAEIVERVFNNVEKHKDLLDRLKDS